MKFNIPKPSEGISQTPEAKAPANSDIAISPDSVKATRKALGLTVEQFAWLFGVSPSSIFRYESTGIPAVHYGALTRKIHLLGFWLKDRDSVETMAQLLMVKDGLASLSGLLEMGGALMAQESAEAKAGAPGSRGQGQKAAKKAEAKSSPAKTEPAKTEPAKTEPAKPEPAATAKPEAPNGAEEKAPPNGLNGFHKLPTLMELAKRGFRAFNLAASVLDQDGEGVPMLSQAEPKAGPRIMETQAKELEAEAALIEAQAKKLEAEARKM
ncbi:MAG: hypothetical protein LBE49_09070, partial [Deltaproteobacteria bacterium]|nr:hypothetical protein [Deltaproteobacteria bacterium]